METRPDTKAHRLAALVGSLHEGILLEDSTRHIELVNDAFCRLFGIPAPPAALVGADCSRAAEDSAALFKDPAGFLTRVRAVLSAGEPVTGDQLTLVDGRTFERDYVPVFVDGSPQGHLWKYRDVTNQVRQLHAQRQLDELTQSVALAEREEDAYAHGLRALMSDPRWRFAAAFSLEAAQTLRDGDVTSAPVMRALATAAARDVAAEDAREYDAVTRAQRFASGEGLPGLAWASGQAECHTRESVATRCERVALARRLGWQALIEIPVKTSAGVTGVIELAATTPVVWNDVERRMLSQVGERMGRIVERLRGQQVRQTAAQWMRMIVDRMMEGLIVVEDATGRIAFVNGAAEELFGYPAGGMVGLHVSTLVGGTQREVPGFLEQAYAAAIGRITEWTARRRDGSEFPMELQLAEFDPGDGRRLVGFVRDLSERDAADRMKKEFIATVSHELRTPLTSIRASLGLLEAGVLGPLEGEAREVVTVANRSALRLVDLINDILDLERAGGSGGLSLTLGTHDLDGILGRAADALAPMAGEVGVTIDVAAGGLTVRADAARAEQVVLNLLSNAVKHSPMGEHVTVETRRAGTMARIEVLDRGPGVPEELRAAIFEPFRQGESTDNRQRQGSGLGLAISRAIVRDHGGQIGVEPRDGGGSVFWCTVPLAEAPTP